MKLFSVTLLSVLLAAVALADHGNNGRRNRHSTRVTGQQGRFRNFPNNPAVPARPRPAPVQRQQQQHQQPIPVVQPVSVHSQAAQPLPRRGKQLSIPGATINNNSPDANGNYDFNFSTDDGAFRQESGSVRQLGNEEANSITGSFSFISPEGETIQLNYVADENGFQPQGAHLPQAPPLHPAIQRGLELQQRNRERQAQRSG